MSGTSLCGLAWQGIRKRSSKLWATRGGILVTTGRSGNRGPPLMVASAE